LFSITDGQSSRRWSYYHQFQIHQMSRPRPNRWLGMLEVCFLVPLLKPDPTQHNTKRTSTTLPMFSVMIPTRTKKTSDVISLSPKT
jgi:hypothetical protein